MITLRALHKRILKAKADIVNPYGFFALGVENAVKKTANHVADNIPASVFRDRSGTLRMGIRNSYKVEYPNRATLLDEETMDNYMNRVNPTSKSVYNKRSYPSYWRFIYYGWGPAGGNTSHPAMGYINAILVSMPFQERLQLVSPFHPQLKYYNEVAVLRHPGREARDWLMATRSGYEKVFNQEMQIMIDKFLIKFGLK